MILFWIVAVIAVASALTVILHRNVVYCALALVVTLFQVALMFAALDAHLIALLQVIVYAGAIMVLFVFVIMLLNAGEEERTKGSRVALLLGVPGMLAGSLLLAWVLLERSGTGEIPAGALPGAPKTLGWLLFHDFLLPFEVTSILVLIAIMGAVVLASHPDAPPQTRKEG